MEPRAKRPARVLVVEDDADSAALLTALLERIGFETVFEEDGPSALATARVWRPEVVLLDLGLPGMSGFETAVALRADADGHELHIIALTGSADDDARRRALEAGCESHLVKGVRLESLLAAIESGGPPRN